MQLIASLILFSWLLTGCVQQSSQRIAATTGTTTTPTTNYSASDVTLKWYYLLNTTSSLTFTRDNLDNAYMRGTQIENYLITQNDPNAIYCVEFNFGSSIPSPQKYRVRAVPITVNDLTTKKQTLYMRLDFNNSAAGSTSCALSTVEFVNDTTTTTVAYATVASQITFALSGVCPTCLNTLTAQTIRLFKQDQTVLPNVLKQVKPADVNVGLLAFLYDTKTTATSPSNQCSTSGCRDKGYDCCLDGQCVNDGATKTGVSLTNPSYVAAENEKIANPLAFLNYPQFYYICSENQATNPGTGTGGTTTDPEAAAAARFASLLADYNCIQEIITKAAVTPYQSQPLNPSATYDQTKCNTVDATNTMYYTNVLTRLYDNCGCSGQTTLSDKLLNCPKYSYAVATQSVTGIPTGLVCTVIADTGATIPFQNGSINVSSRTAPHRFYNTNGIEINVDKALTVTNTTQEGDSFQYLDTQKIQPQQTAFSINALLGPMSVSLDKAVPAKMIDIEIDKIYLIATKSGYYTPCSTCAKDSWFNTFTSTPSSSNGVGLQATGWNTDRENFGTNSTLGNYEDTIFGRACYVPPTMIPFTHKTKINIQSQRMDRLSAQAAIYANGYQRDWYGFNRGALIGSFDGVSWFAIGKGRIIKSKSQKLFLAVNAPFADLADASFHVVTIQTYDSQSIAATSDYDPAYTRYSAQQNEAGNCQFFHQCATDTDCVTKLGWEYMCADVKDVKTNWPDFDPNNASEKSGSLLVGFEGILAQGNVNGSSTKRCVYRGAGSVCRTDSGAQTDRNKQKLLTCAANFHCEDLDSTASIFNKNVARYGSTLENIPVSKNHLFGKDANVLGRPLDYIFGSNLTTLPSNIKDNIETNVIAMDPGAATKVGLCRPGKALPITTNISTFWNPFEQHKSADTSFNRTDFINQIGSCYSNNFTDDKMVSCPVIDSTGNFYQFNASNTFTQSAYSTEARFQNGCGLETLSTSAVISGSSTADTLQAYSPFKAIEARPLSTTDTQVSKTFVRDACFRKAGAVCNSDYDCSPNKLYAAQVEFFATKYFGNLPNQKYYQEYLVCGQTAPQPKASEANFQTYDMSLNRCCREVGSDITTYTADTPISTNSGTAADDATTFRLGTGSSLSIPASPATLPISSNVNPNSAFKYERLKVVKNLGTDSTRPLLTAFDDRDASGNILYTASSVANVLTPNQWQTLNDTNSKTCCGGGWIRKFQDGTTDWTKKDRLRLDVNNFKCLNYRTPLISTESPSVYGLSSSDIDIDLPLFCSDGNFVSGGCAQIAIPSSTTASCSNVQSCNGSTDKACTVGTSYTVSTLPAAQGWSAQEFAFYLPQSADDNSSVSMDFSDPLNLRRNITIRAPSYMGAALIGIQFERQDSGSTSLLTCTDNSAVINPNIQTSVDDSNSAACLAADPVNGCCAANCCYGYNSSSRVLKVVLSTGTAFRQSKAYGTKLTFKAPGTVDYVNTIPSSAQSKPACSDAHYLSVLGKLELTGIPQISYEKIVCNNDTKQLVPGLYTATTVAGFDTMINSYRLSSDSTAESSLAARKTNFKGLAVDQVFSSQDFKCCTPLGKTTSNINTCCSGYGTGTSPTFTCKLPRGTDLNVYFNRYVSNEGQGTNQPSGGLASTDFDATTGEPLVLTSVAQKLSALGAAYCDAGSASAQVIRGGAFGQFAPEPSSSGFGSSSKIYGIVDSSSDTGTTSNAGATTTVGFNTFNSGLRWNHHLYCR